MLLSEIRNMPTTVDLASDVPDKIHESLFRSWHIVAKIEELCEAKTPHSVILELIADMRCAPNKPLEYNRESAFL